MDSLAIHPLSEKPECASICAAWSFGEWGCHIEGATLEQFQKNYVQRAKMKNALPFVAVALWEDKLAGMISLKEKDHPDHEDLGPWVGSLYVHRRFQGKGIAGALYAWLAERAKEDFGFERLYTFTCRSPRVYESMGWERIGMVRDTTGFHADGEPLLMKVL